jgi:chorismate mutase
MRDIAAWRKRIDAIDRKLLELVNERAKCALEIGRIKQKSGLPVLDAGREKEIFDRIRRLNGGPFSGDAVVSIFRCLIGESRKLEQVD